jgi:hypothetical protein
MNPGESSSADQLRAGQEEVIRYIQKQPHPTKQITALKWTLSPKGDSCILEFFRGESSHMIVFTTEELAELGSGGSQRALEKADRFFGSRDDQ